MVALLRLMESICQQRMMTATVVRATAIDTTATIMAEKKVLLFISSL